MKTKCLKLAGAPTLASCALLRKSKRLTTRVVFLLVIAVQWTALTFRVSADAVMDWNVIMQETMAAANPHFQSRAGAIVQLSVFEAVNAIVGGYEPYLGTIAAPAGMKG